MLMAVFNQERFGFNEVSLGKALIYLDNLNVGTRVAIGIDPNMKQRLEAQYGEGTNEKIISEVFYTICNSIAQSETVILSNIATVYPMLKISQSSLSVVKARQTMMNKGVKQVKSQNVRYLYTDKKIISFTECSSDFSVTDASLILKFGDYPKQWELKVKNNAGIDTRIIKDILFKYIMTTNNRHIDVRDICMYLSNTTNVPIGHFATTVTKNK